MTESDSKADHTSRHDALLAIFQMSREQQNRMMTVIGNVICNIRRLRNKQGQPIRWCYVPTLPTYRNATGMCLSLDFGCSDHYIRLSLFSIHRGGSHRSQLIDNRVFILTPSIRHADMCHFCDFVAMCIEEMLSDNRVACTGNSQTVYMGVAAGFDVRVKAQRRPASATVQFASKDFKMNGFIGFDFVPQFHEAFKRIDLKVEIVTVINDTVGILLDGIHKNANCSIGVLCHRGGSNVAYLETNRDFLDLCSSDERLLLPRPVGTGHCVIVNAEAGYSIGDKDELKDLENIIERHVIKKLNAVFRLECIISGTWYSMLLEYSVQILLATNAINGRPDDVATWKLNLSKGFEVFTRCDDWLASKTQTDTQLASDLKQLLGFARLSPTDATLIAKICRAIVCRTAKVTAICITAIAHNIYGAVFPASMAVAYGGSLFTSLSQLKDMLKSELNALKPDNTEVLLVHSDVSHGCAVTATCAGSAR